MSKGVLMVISGPSGSGKGTVVNELIKSGDYALSISATTRSPREGERDGVNYFFKTRDEFESMIADGDFLEYAQFCNNYYGTPLPYVKAQLEAGKNIILEIEVQGAFQVKEKLPETVLVFLAPPSLDELRARLTGRGTETPEVIEQRMNTAVGELKMQDKYDYVVVNNVVEDAVADINAIVRAQALKVK